MKRFWIILGVVVAGLALLFVFNKPAENNKDTFTGDAKTIQTDDHVIKAPKEKVVLIEYADFQCPSCAAVYPILKELKVKYKENVTFVFRHLPLIQIHPNAFAAARAAEAASNQGKFWEMHNQLFETQNSWGQLSTNQQKVFESYAEDLGLDMTKFKADYASEAVAARINRDVSSATQFSATGTPTFILNGDKIENPRDKSGYESLIDDAIAKSKQQ